MLGFVLWGKCGGLLWVHVLWGVKVEAAESTEPEGRPWWMGGRGVSSSSGSPAVSHRWRRPNAPGDPCCLTTPSIRNTAKSPQVIVFVLIMLPRTRDRPLLSERKKKKKSLCMNHAHLLLNASGTAFARQGWVSWLWHEVIYWCFRGFFCPANLRKPSPSVLSPQHQGPIRRLRGCFLLQRSVSTLSKSSWSQHRDKTERGATGCQTTSITSKSPPSNIRVPACHFGS